MTGRHLSVLSLLIATVAAATVWAPTHLRSGDADASTSTTTALAPDADARVRQGAHETNYGEAPRLRVRGGNGTHNESYLKFTIPDGSDAIESVKLRVFAFTGTVNGPAVASSETQWSESRITWRNRPGRTSQAIENKGAIPARTWVEFDVTPLVSGPGTYSFVLVGDATDAVDFFAREASTPNTPQLVVETSADPGSPPPAASQCADGIDNDGDAKVDFPSDPGCSSSTDDTESPDPVPSDGAGKVVLAAGDIQPPSLDGGSVDTAALVRLVPHDAVIALGDNQYENGTLAEYSNFWAHTWGAFNSELYPTPGNHEHHSGTARNYCAYFAGKTPIDVCANSTTDPYYKVTIGDWDVFAVDTGATGDLPAATKAWLDGQLAASTASCQLVFWHHPRYSAGPHGPTASQADDWAMLMDNGVELVLSGHDHNVQVWDRMGADGAPDAADGIRQLVVGTGGKSHYTTGNRPTGLAYINTAAFGVMKLTLRADDYDWEFLGVGNGAPLTTGTDTCH